MANQRLNTKRDLLQSLIGWRMSRKIDVLYFGNEPGDPFSVETKVIEEIQGEAMAGNHTLNLQTVSERMLGHIYLEIVGSRRED